MTTLMEKANGDLFEAIKIFKKERNYKRLSVKRKVELTEEILKDENYIRNGVHIVKFKDGNEIGFFTSPEYI